jgi:SOS response regulatory protein OraA/RecX
MRYLAPAARSCHEVRSFLTTKGWTAPIAAVATQRLVELGILDDRRFAADAVRNGVLRRREAPAKVAAALAARGIAEEVIAECLAGLQYPGPDGAGELWGGNRDATRQGWVAREGAGADPVQLALDAGADRLRVLHGSPVSVQRRLGGFLARRGYDADVIEEVCRRLVAGLVD